MRNLLGLAFLLLGLLTSCRSTEQVQYVDPGDVAIRTQSDPRTAVPILSDPVGLIVNQKRQRLYDVAMEHFRSYYESQHSMCIAAPFLWEVNPHLTDVYDVAAGSRVFVPSGEDYVRWRNANLRLGPNQTAFIADPETKPVAQP